MRKILLIYLFFTGFIFASTFDGFTLGMTMEDAKSTIHEQKYKIKKHTNEKIQYVSEVLTFEAKVTLYFTALNHKLYKIEICWGSLLKVIHIPNANNPDAYLYAYWEQPGKQFKIKKSNEEKFQETIISTLTKKYGDYYINEGFHTWRSDKNLIVQFTIPDNERFFYHKLVYTDNEIMRHRKTESNKFKEIKAKQQKQEMINSMKRDYHRF